MEALLLFFENYLVIWILAMVDLEMMIKLKLSEYYTIAEIVRMLRKQGENRRQTLTGTMPCPLLSAVVGVVAHGLVACLAWFVLE